MPGFAPFRGLRYDRSALPGSPSLDLLVAPPYDVIDPGARAALAARHEVNAVRLILPDGDDDSRYAGAAALLAAWRADGILAVDEAPAFFTVRMRFCDEDGSTRETVGVLGAMTLPETPHRDTDGPATPASVLPHERTLPKAKSDRLALLAATRTNLDPIWGLTAAPITAALIPDRPADLATTDDDGVSHELWVIDDPESIVAIRAGVESAPIVLADGHHRFETAITYRNERRAAGAAQPGDDAILTLVVELTDDQLCVRSINRIVHDLPAEVDLRAIAASGDAFGVEDLGPNTPEGVEDLRRAMHTRGGIGLVHRKGLTLLVPREARTATDAAWPHVVAEVDAAVFETALAPHLGPARIEYRNDEALAAALVEKDAADAAFLLRPVTVAQTRAASLAGVRMPQKTTFFYPKPRTGLVFRDLDA